MKIKSIKLKNFKRFTDLSIEHLPETAKLVVLVGPNGSGKTSIFEAFNHWYRLHGYGNVGSRDFFEKKGLEHKGDDWFSDRVSIDFYGFKKKDRADIKGKFYFRTAYRNEPDFTISRLEKLGDPTDNVGLATLMQNDVTVSNNYQRLVAKTLEGVYNQENDVKSVATLRNELVGKIKAGVSAVFEGLKFSTIGDPLSNGSFFFEKGASKDFHYKNLSAGEKSAFDIILDLIIKSSYYTEAVYCIDEPEAHMHTRLQARLLREIYKITPAASQIWISTHSIGMLKEAEEIEAKNPGTVVFLDFDNRDFDVTELMRPAAVGKAVWDRFFDLAFGDFSSLIAPSTIVFCEGTSQGRKYKDFDAQILSLIFGDKQHGTMFVSVGSCTDIEDIENKSVKVVANILKSSTIIKYIDRDGRSEEEVEELRAKGIRVSARRHIESYLLDDEVLRKLCGSLGMPERTDACLAVKETAIAASISRGNASDDVKSAAGSIFVELKRLLDITRGGNNVCAFMRDTLAPLITRDMAVYHELHRGIFAPGEQ
jgi:predicted ATPase